MAVSNSSTQRETFSKLSPSASSPRTRTRLHRRRPNRDDGFSGQAKPLAAAGIAGVVGAAGELDARVDALGINLPSVRLAVRTETSFIRSASLAMVGLLRTSSTDSSIPWSE